jgi:hypothetical protein
MFWSVRAKVIPDFIQPLLHMLDEADRMLYMGFEPEVCSILSQKNYGK